MGYVYLSLYFKRMMNHPVAQFFVTPNLMLTRRKFAAVKRGLESYRKEILVLVLKISIS
jgi:hypothetical protein